MEPISKIASLLEGIREKHGSAATFTIKNFGENISYTTYIASDVPPSHHNHDNLNDAISRLREFVEISDLKAHNREIARQTLDSLKEKQDHISDQIEECLKYL